MIVAITNNPYQGLKQEFLLHTEPTPTVAITNNPYQGLKPSNEGGAIFYRVAITNNPYQGLKPVEHWTAYLSNFLGVAITNNPYQGLKPDSVKYSVLIV
ncbi:conserved hypothetical protein [Planktothrix serta PCC 8927]|uniref:Uncharacterized protein n=1 Tax=Planktothrix serta PCC 8927 TaxID=671068 RepID=A0A7Z9BXN9_9CYAN|nr:conserved hypothetical protein [Planktothrix serta PCC 8927]